MFFWNLIIKRYIQFKKIILTYLGIEVVPVKFIFETVWLIILFLFLYGAILV